MPWKRPTAKKNNACCGEGSRPFPQRARERESELRIKDDREQVAAVLQAACGPQAAALRLPLGGRVRVVVQRRGVASSSRRRRASRSPASGEGEERRRDDPEDGSGGREAGRGGAEEVFRGGKRPDGDLRPLDGRPAPALAHTIHPPPPTTLYKPISLPRHS